MFNICGSSASKYKFSNFFHPFRLCIALERCENEENAYEWAGHSEQKSIVIKSRGLFDRGSEKPFKETRASVKLL